MKFRDYLNEDKVDRMEFINAVEKDCKPYLQILKRAEGAALTRNVTYNVSFYMKKKVRQDRRPMDTPKILHNLIDNYLYKKFGGRPRSNGLFCGANFRPRGHQKFIFPIGPFEYIWSPKARDLYVTLKNIGEKELGHRYEMKGVEKEGDKNDFYEFFEHLKKDLLPSYKDTDLMKVLKEQETREVMIGCEEYYIINGYKFLNIQDGTEWKEMMRKI